VPLHQRLVLLQRERVDLAEPGELPVRLRRAVLLLRPHVRHCDGLRLRLGFGGRGLRAESASRPLPPRCAPPGGHPQRRRSGGRWRARTVWAGRNSRAAGCLSSGSRGRGGCGRAGILSRGHRSLKQVAAADGSPAGDAPLAPSRPEAPEAPAGDAPLARRRRKHREAPAGTGTAVRAYGRRRREARWRGRRSGRRGRTRRPARRVRPRTRSAACEASCSRRSRCSLRRSRSRGGVDDSVEFSRNRCDLV